MKNISIIGAGAVGRSIALALFYNKIPVSGIYSRNGRSAALLAKKIKTKRASSIEEILLFSNFMFICVPDEQISEVVLEMVMNGKRLDGKTIVHTSGALSSDELSLLRKLGASVGSFHPLQTFLTQKKQTSFKNIWIILEGTAKAIVDSKLVARQIGAKCFLIAKRHKTIYHIAAVFASNYQVTLFSIVEHLAGHSGIPQRHLWKMFGPLITQTAENVLKASPTKALTGPIARGDVRTVERHIAALGGIKKLRHLIPLYAGLGMETIALTKRKKNAR